MHGRRVAALPVVGEREQVGPLTRQDARERRITKLLQRHPPEGHRQHGDAEAAQPQQHRHLVSEVPRPERVPVQQQHRDIAGQQPAAGPVPGRVGRDPDVGVDPDAIAHVPQGLLDAPREPGDVGDQGGPYGLQVVVIDLPCWAVEEAGLGLGRG